MKRKANQPKATTGLPCRGTPAMALLGPLLVLCGVACIACTAAQEFGAFQPQHQHTLQALIKLQQLVGLVNRDLQRGGAARSDVAART